MNGFGVVCGVFVSDVMLESSQVLRSGELVSLTLDPGELWPMSEDEIRPVRFGTTMPGSFMTRGTISPGGQIGWHWTAVMLESTVDPVQLLKGLPRWCCGGICAKQLQTGT